MDQSSTINTGMNESGPTTCPSCGYCAHCGRRDAAPYVPYNPYPRYPSPWWGVTPPPDPYITWTDCGTTTTGTTMNFKLDG